MKNLNISYWSKGNLSNSYDKELNLKLIELFVKTIKEYSTNINIVLNTDTYTVDNISKYVLDNTNVNNILDIYNEYEPWEWVYIKLKNILDIKDDIIIHMDFDIILKYDLSTIIQCFIDSNVDVLYQKHELLSLRNYIDFYRNRPEYKNVYDGAKTKAAFNAGITIIKNKKIKNQISDIVKNFKYYNWIDLLNLEQTIIPATLMSSGHNVSTLTDISTSLVKVQPTKKFIGNNELDINIYNQLCNTGVFMENIGFYHFLGNIKQKENILDVIKEIIDL